VLRSLASYGFAPDECVPLRVAARDIVGLEGDARARFKRAMVHERALINWEPLAFAGRATKELRDHIRLRPIDKEIGPPCSAAGRQVTATTNGQLYPCCSVWTNFPEHAYGTAQAAADLPAALEQMRQDPLVRVLHERGPGHLIAQLRQAGSSIASDYSDICHMCQTLFQQCSLDDLRQTAATVLELENGTAHSRTGGHSHGPENRSGVSQEVD
jgi:hypothetical protein